jgi:hypothetical protein
MGTSYKILVGKLVGKRSLERPKRRWKDIQMDLKRTECEVVDWIQLAQNEVQ